MKLFITMSVLLITIHLSSCVFWNLLKGEMNSEIELKTCENVFGENSSKREIIIQNVMNNPNGMPQQGVRTVITIKKTPDPSAKKRFIYRIRIAKAISIFFTSIIVTKIACEWFNEFLQDNL